MVSFMKKFILFVFFLLFINNPPMPVFNEIKLESNTYILEFPNQNISTNNFDLYFNDINVVWIEPYINDLYKIKKRYQFKDIQTFKNDVINELIKSNYKNESINLNISGIIIKKIKVNCDLDKIKKLNIENIIINQ